MPIQSTISEQGRILVLTISDPWSITEIAGIDSVARPVFERIAREHPNWRIHALVDMRQARHIPRALLQSRSAFRTLRHPNAGYTVLLGASTGAQVFGESLFRLARYDRIRFFKVEDDARAFLAELMAKEDAAAST